MSSRSSVVVPEIEGQIYRWRFGEVSFEVDAAVGARIVGFRIGNENILTGPEVNALNYGSTFWTSPQADWNWPPVVEIDGGAYAVTGEGADLVFQSAVGGQMGIAVSKKFHVDSDRETVTIEYTMENRSTETRTVAPWEISRLATGGLTFFPKGAGVLPPSTLKVSEAVDAIWFDYDPAPITDHQKLFAHGSEGWVAHIDKPRRMLLIKTFPPIDRNDHAPGESEIELYGDPEHTYVEVEQQGAYRPLAPGARVDWVVVWRLRRVPLGIDIATGNKDLLALVRALSATSQPVATAQKSPA
ncbi:MAG: DUF4380 domain-containing protein [Bacteroidota bacterium]